jgi:hypothetical protein
VYKENCLVSHGVNGVDVPVYPVDPV